jgi:hypothetical protein
MIPAKLLLTEVVTSLRNVIAPAIDEPCPKTQAYMVILEIVSRQVDERADVEQHKSWALDALFRDLAHFGRCRSTPHDGVEGERRLCNLIH